MPLKLFSFKRFNFIYKSKGRLSGGFNPPLRKLRGINVEECSKSDFLNNDSRDSIAIRMLPQNFK
ncbi:hypothetical protein bsdcttw_23610 [Anaerocolumna chitinilytica]|uniref:Uncharacterized protein n=1 Tax=Anaerocolumna chitinilytica TaxID=1727145 RepID=A0A7I8DLT0_9FIRM|nr:hypothetical protein bsdcttw_23610 [Anaerocolumna chitinilytica]